MCSNGLPGVCVVWTCFPVTSVVSLPDPGEGDNSVVSDWEGMLWGVAASREVNVGEADGDVEGVLEVGESDREADGRRSNPGVDRGISPGKGRIKGDICPWSNTARVVLSSSVEVFACERTNGVA